MKEKIDNVSERKDLFITSKLWNTKHHPDDVIPSLKQSLSDLQLDYIDLYFIHGPVGFEAGEELLPLNRNGTVRYSHVHYLDTWKAMEECVNQGLAKSIGLSSFNLKHVVEVTTN